MVPKNSDLVAPTVMAIRETLMVHYRKTCVRRITTQTNVQIWENYILIGGSPFVIVNRDKKTLTFVTAVTNRSPQFRAIKRQLKIFLQKYLPEVTIKEIKGI